MGEANMRRAYRLRGVVQGVGFRPHVARVASDFPITGFVGNDDESVFIEVQGNLQAARYPPPIGSGSKMRRPRNARHRR